MKLVLFVVAVTFVIGSSSVLTKPFNDAQDSEGMALTKRIVYVTGRSLRSNAALDNVGASKRNSDEFEEVGLVKRTRHKHRHHHRHHHGHHGHKSKGMAAMPPAAAMGGGAAAGGMAAGAPDMAASGAADAGAGAADAGASDMSAAQ
ncbi:uncharacterized protein FA14DRAFT_185498 [Meira miltonrushii]|uniref:Uncharacterized protein n=1 Tax=Meira miltonrushii TaxID=1280837 RepID=A0A316V9I1_9BASI|nr:uncharacterized protein FA14DRAFT_185498 [Meira miltonrushii]PWN34146.1 hypothetical protein FA14DRAFT_185498 [Meira miltonrushii]